MSSRRLAAFPDTRKRSLENRSGPQGSSILVGDQLLVNFSSNDYLGLANDPQLTAAAHDAMGLYGVGAGAAIALFMPLCQFKRENIIVDFFTAKCSEATHFKLDRLGDLLMTIIFSLLAWRCGAAAINAKETMGASMLLGFPDWIVFTSMCIPFGISAVIAAMQTLSSMDYQKAST